ncbi:hypothetical protein Rmf_34800 [Roseomonas fluvialis]|uniref:Uncharacterized protein n=1 Tax=Roseomonas fluvialis TaxID=1750527 RepID=A0ABN6P518_9PROT|nr:hypothetical protein Rmf_34800 [Roseomonas fluvialis]
METNATRAAARSRIADILRERGTDRLGIRWPRLDATAAGSRAPRLDCLLRCLPGTLTGMEVVLAANGLGPPDYPAARAPWPGWSRRRSSTSTRSVDGAVHGVRRDRLTA